MPTTPASEYPAEPTPTVNPQDPDKGGVTDPTQIDNPDESESDESN